jgi:hypothetical protein
MRSSSTRGSSASGVFETMSSTSALPPAALAVVAAVIVPYRHSRVTAARS